MSTPKHTPGPWAAERTADAAPGESALRIVDKRGTSIAAMVSVFSEHRAEQDANARLIAAAPDMFAACGSGRVDGQSLLRWAASLLDSSAPEVAAKLREKDEAEVAALAKAGSR